MKKIFLLAAILFIQLIVNGQSSESEPNNSFSTANELINADPTDATLDGTDTVDYYGLKMTRDANFYLVIHLTNVGSNGQQQLQVDLFNSLRISGQYVGNFYRTSYLMNEGSSYTDTIKICGLASDSFYVKILSQGEFEYNLEWFPVNAFTPDDLYYGYNNSPGTAAPFTMNSQKEGSLRYKYWGNDAWDTDDYFTTTLPAGNYASVSLTIRAQNNYCSGPPAGMQYFCYKNGSLTPFASGYVGNNPSVSLYQEVITTVPLNTLQQGDVLLVRFTSTAPFGYRFGYGIAGEFDPDPEDNCCTNNAISVLEGETFTGHVGEYDYLNDIGIDDYDTYRVILPHDGAINLFVKGRNDECTEEYYTLSCDVLDKYGNYLTSVDLMTWDNYPSCGEIQNATVKLRGFAADTFYLQLNTYNSYYYGQVSYNIRYEMTDSTASDPNDSYNNPVTTILPVNAGETKKGHVRFFKSLYTYDPSDIYKATMPADGSITVYLKATHRSEYDGFNGSNSNRLTFVTTNITRRTPGNPPVTYMTPDGVYLDTFKVCGLGAGDLYFTISSSIGYEYEFRYEISDTSSVDNDVEPNNTFTEATVAGGGVTKKGHIHYTSNVTTDTYDYYKMIYSGNDSLKIPLQATNMSCLSNQSVTFDGYNKNHTQIFSKVKSNVGPGQTVYDTVRISVTAPDTIYLRSSATGAFNYQFSTSPKLPTSLFTITGDSTVCYGTEVYTAHNIGPDAVDYNWSLPLGGGSISFVDSVATVTWNGSGNRSVQLYLSNSVGNSQAKTRTVYVDAAIPSIAPVLNNFARTLSISAVPAAVQIQWLRNNAVIPNNSDSTYYAALAGEYTVRYTNYCGEGPISNSFSFPNDALAQTINFPNTPDQQMAPSLKIKLPATASSGLPVYYTKISGQGSITLDTLLITSVGTIIIKASQPGDDVYSAAPVKYDTIVVTKGNQSISFDSIPDKFYRTGNFTIYTSSSSGLNVAESIVSGNATVSSNIVHITGVGMITVRATQAGNSNYNAATPVERSFCVGIDTLPAISGASVACLGTYTYRAQKIPGANYVWTLSGGGTMTTSNDTAFVTWQSTGTHTLSVKANSSCNTTYSYEPQIAVTISNVIPTAVGTMLPADNAQNQSLPLVLSWIPGQYAESYDLYVWDSASAQPGTPYQSNITSLTYTIPQLAFPYNTTYKWRLVSKNPCNQVSGPVQTFRLVPLPDLTVTSVLAPSSAISGQTISINWTVKNNGPGNTPTSATWQDAVYLSFDTLPNLSSAPEVNPLAWTNVSFPVKPLLLGNKNNVSALQAGEQYSNSIDFTIPINYSIPVYAYVVTNSGRYGIIEVTKANDTAHAVNPINITLAPTPDLRVDSLFTPASTFSGSTVNISYKVKNYGALTPAGASWQDAAYLSQSLLFDSANAIRLDAPKANGSYYPNAARAGTSVSTQLQPDSFYFRNFQAVIPNNLFGTWFIHVKTNNSASLYEGPAFGNNTNTNAIQVYLTPTPKLTVSELSLPVTSASTTQTIGANWNIYNDGFRDNIEKNRGHYLTISVCAGPCGGPDQVCLYPYVAKDSVVFGSSYWIDRVYLSTDPNGLNIANATLVGNLNHGTQYSGLYPDINYMAPCGTITSTQPRINVDNVIDPGSNFPSSTNFKVPSDLPPGDYYVYVYTNPTKTVFEYPGTAQIKRSDLPITISRPDLTVPNISVPANTIGGQPVTITYDILNTGAGAVFNHLRTDRLYVSNNSVFDGSAQLVASTSYTESVPVSTPVSHSFTYTFAATTTGNRYFYVVTNADSAFRETNQNNNRSAAAATLVSQAIPADLIVSAIQTTDTVVTVFPAILAYTLTNNGSGVAQGNWTDSIYVSCNSTYSPSTAFYVGKKLRSLSIAPGASISDTVQITVPFTYHINSCFTNNDFNNVYFFVKTNTNGGAYEGANTTNNVTASAVKKLDNPLIDHTITTVNGADSATVGHIYNLSWNVKNIGRNPVIEYATRVDSIYFSTDSVLNGNAVYASKKGWSDRLEHNISKTLTLNFAVTNLPSGYYYLLVNTNASRTAEAEKDYSNNINLIRDNNNAAKKIWVTRPLLPDLVDSILSAPTEIATGQPGTVIHRVKNTGDGATYPGTIVYSLILANDASGSSFTTPLTYKTYHRTLQPGEYFDDTISIFIPSSQTPRIYTLLGKVNPPSVNSIIESNEGNNTALTYLTVYRPEPSDLIVQDVTTRDTATLGYNLDSARWVIRNNSDITAKGQYSDGIYLSKSATFDSTAVLIGINTRLINLAPLQNDTLKLKPIVTGVTEGDYHLFVRTDMVDQIPETDETNNTAFSAGQVFVKVKELALNVTENNTLYTDTRFYKLVIPDSLDGATISVKLTTADSLTRINQMFIGYGYIPTAASFDYTYPNANYGNQDIIMTNTSAGVYYISIRTINPGAVVQNISVHAKKLPFAIASVQSASGGNIGNVTVKLSGSLFAPGMTVKLNKPGTEIIATTVYFTSSTVVYATFNLQNKPLGIYDVTLSKGDTATAVLAGSFSIVPANNGGLITGSGNNTGSGDGNAPGCDPGAPSGLNSQLVTELLVPEYVFRGWPFIIQINYNNPTNYDIPAQVLTLYAEEIISLGLTQQDANSNGKHSLTLELTGQDGPPGIIRAGGSGTIFVYGRSDISIDPHTITIFKLK